MSVERALLAAMRATAAADGGVRAILGDPARLYDDHPPDPIFPYATIGRVESKPIDAVAARGFEHAVTLHVWSRYGGRAEALDALGAVRMSLHDQALSLSGASLVLLLATFVDVFRAGDGRTTHGVLRLRAITELN